MLQVLLEVAESAIPAVDSDCLSKREGFTGSDAAPSDPAQLYLIDISLAETMSLLETPGSCSLSVAK